MKVGAKLLIVVANPMRILELAISVHAFNATTSYEKGDKATIPNESIIRSSISLK
jgi:hypothetical protein